MAACCSNWIASAELCVGAAQRRSHSSRCGDTVVRGPQFEGRGRALCPSFDVCRRVQERKGKKSWLNGMHHSPTGCFSCAPVGLNAVPFLSLDAMRTAHEWEEFAEVAGDDGDFAPRRSLDWWGLRLRGWDTVAGRAETCAQSGGSRAPLHAAALGHAVFAWPILQARTTHVELHVAQTLIPLFPGFARDCAAHAEQVTAAEAAHVPLRCENSPGAHTAGGTSA